MAKTARLPDGTTLSFPDDVTPEEMDTEVNNISAGSAPVAPPSGVRQAATALGFDKALDVGEGVARGAGKLAGEAVDTAGAAARAVGGALADPRGTAESIGRQAGGLASEVGTKDYWSHIGQAMAGPLKNPIPSTQAKSEAEGVAETLGEAATEPVKALASHVPFVGGLTFDALNWGAQTLAPAVADLGMNTLGTGVNIVGEGLDSLTRGAAAALAGTRNPKGEENTRKVLETAELLTGAGDLARVGRGAPTLAESIGSRAGEAIAQPVKNIADAGLKGTQDFFRGLVKWDQGEADKAEATLEKYDTDVQEAARVNTPDFESKTPEEQKTLMDEARKSVPKPNMNPTSFSPGWIGLGRIYSELDAMGLSATSKTAFEKVEHTLRNALWNALSSEIDKTISQMKNKLAGDQTEATQALNEAHARAAEEKAKSLAKERMDAGQTLKSNENLSVKRVDDLTDSALKDLQTSIDKADPGRLYADTVHKVQTLKSGLENRANRLWYGPARELASNTRVSRSTEGVMKTLRDQGLKGSEFSDALKSPYLRGVYDRLGTRANLSFVELHDLRTRLNYMLRDQEVRPNLEKGQIRGLRDVIDNLLHEGIPEEWKPAVAKLDQGDSWYKTRMKQFNEPALQAMLKSIKAGTSPDPEKAIDVLNAPGMKERRRQILKALEGPVHPEASEASLTAAKGANLEGFKGRYLSATLSKALSDSQLKGAVGTGRHSYDTNKLLDSIHDLHREEVLQDYGGKELADRLYDSVQRLAYASGKNAVIDMSGDKSLEEAVEQSNLAQARSRDFFKTDPVAATERIRAEAAKSNPLSGVEGSGSACAAVDALLKPGNEANAIHALDYLDKTDPKAASLLRQQATRRVFEPFFTSKHNKPKDPAMAHALHIQTMAPALIDKLWPGVGRDIETLAQHVQRIMGPEGAGMPGFAAGALMDMPPFNLPLIRKFRDQPNLGNLFKALWHSRFTRVGIMEGIVNFTMDPARVRWILNEWSIGGARGEKATEALKRGIARSIQATFAGMSVSALENLLGMPGSDVDPFASFAPPKPNFEGKSGAQNLSDLLEESRRRRGVR